MPVTVSPFCSFVVTSFEDLLGQTLEMHFVEPQCWQHPCSGGANEGIAVSRPTANVESPQVGQFCQSCVHEACNLWAVRSRICGSFGEVDAKLSDFCAISAELIEFAFAVGPYVCSIRLTVDAETAQCRSVCCNGSDLGQSTHFADEDVKCLKVADAFQEIVKCL